MLRADEDFTTESTMSHATMLTNGRMELGGNFNQSGHTASFGSSANFTIAFMGSGEHEAHFDNIEYSRFANIDVAHANVVMKDEKLIATGRMLFCIGKGFVSGLQEALATEGLNATAIAFTTAVGIAITAGMAVLPAAIVAIISTVAALLSIISASFMAAQAIEGIYSTATGTGTSYQKAEAYAHDAALLLMSIKEIVESGKDILTNLKHLDFIFAGLKGRKTRVDADELGHSVETKAVKTLYSFDDFVDCMQDYLDADSLRYVKQELGKDSDNLSLLNKIAEVVQSAEEVKSGPLELYETKYITNSLFEGVSKDNVLDVIRFMINDTGSDFLDEEAFDYVKELYKLNKSDMNQLVNSVRGAVQAKDDILNLADIKYITRAIEEKYTERVNHYLQGGKASWERGLRDTYEVNVADFQNLTYNGIIKANGRGGKERPRTAPPNSYYQTVNGVHVYIYDHNGELIYDLDAKRMKSFVIREISDGTRYFNDKKLSGEVPDAIKKIFGW